MLRALGPVDYAKQKDMPMNDLIEQRRARFMLEDYYPLTSIVNDHIANEDIYKALNRDHCPIPTCLEQFSAKSCGRDHTCYKEYRKEKVAPRTTSLFFEEKYQEIGVAPGRKTGIPCTIKATAVQLAKDMSYAYAIRKKVIAWPQGSDFDCRLCVEWFKVKGHLEIKKSLMETNFTAKSTQKSSYNRILRLYQQERGDGSKWTDEAVDAFLMCDPIYNYSDDGVAEEDPHDDDDVAEELNAVMMDQSQQGIDADAGGEDMEVTAD